MKLMYYFDNIIKPLLLKGTYYCNPSPTGRLTDNISCIREGDVNIWFYQNEDDIIAVDAGHLNYRGVDLAARNIGIDLAAVKYLFITHADVDHCGGIDRNGINLFPNATVYIGEKEEAYLNKSMHRMTKFGVRIYNCVELSDGYQKLGDSDVVQAGNIEVRAINIPGHTDGHMCYIVDNKVLFSGDCLAVNDTGGYSFFDFFTQFPDENKKSLIRLKDIVEKSDVKYVCTGHSGFRKDMSRLFAHIDKSAIFGKKHPFDTDGPYDFIRD